MSEDKYVFDYVGKDNSVEQFDMSSDRYCSMTPIELYVNGADFNSIKFAITQLSCWQLQELEEIAQLYNDVDLLEFCRLCRNNFRNTEE
ncbi:MAG: hypothetical protein Q7K54_05020 [Candidatus Parcubacteria bacterium]|nr:hypothetical protein [Candidatus Parcubacteria bacterium]